MAPPGPQSAPPGPPSAHRERPAPPCAPTHRSASSASPRLRRVAPKFGTTPTPVPFRPLPPPPRANFLDDALNENRVLKARLGLLIELETTLNENHMLKARLEESERRVRDGEVELCRRAHKEYKEHFPTNSTSSFASSGAGSSQLRARLAHAVGRRLNNTPRVAAADASSSPIASEWTTASWLASEGVNEMLATAVLGPGFTKGGNELDTVRALGHSAALEDELLARLVDGAALLARELAPRLRALATDEVATSAEMQEKFSRFVADGGGFEMKYGDLSTFFNGLEGKIE